MKKNIGKKREWLHVNKMSNLDEFDLNPVVNVEDNNSIEPHSVMSVLPTISITINPPTSTYTTNPGYTESKC